MARQFSGIEEKKSDSVIKFKAGDHSLGSACAEVCPEAAARARPMTSYPDTLRQALLTQGRSSKQDVYFLHKGPKTLLLPAVAVQLRLKAAATKLSERGLLSLTHPVRISAQINTFHCGSHAKRTQRKTLEKKSTRSSE